MNESGIQVSVIIPMYNSCDTIARALSSVYLQTVRPFEVIVVDDGSLDQSAVLVEKFKASHPELDIVLAKKANGGVSSARNHGLKLSRGNLIALLDADDEWIPQKLERQLAMMISNPHIDFLGCARNNEILMLFGKPILALHKATVRELLIKMYPQTSTAIFKKALFEKLGGYNEKMTHAEDGEMWIRYCHGGNFYYMPDSLVITGDGKPSFGHSGLSSNLKAMQKGNEFILRSAWKKRLISLPEFITLMSFSKIKYLRRILITKSRHL